VATSTLDVTGAATYSFDLIWELSVCQPLEGLTHVHTGSIAATLEPGACAVLKTLRSARPNATISNDPNVRPPLMDNAHEVRAKIEQLIRLSDVVKASDKDITWLYDGTPLSDVLRLWAQLGPALVLMTRGDKGAAIGLSLSESRKSHCPLRADQIRSAPRFTRSCAHHLRKSGQTTYCGVFCDLGWWSLARTSWSP
jgi:fructokinase